MCCHDSLILRQTSTLQALFPADNGFDLDSIVVQDHDKFYLREQPKFPPDPESHSQVISDSEDEAHSLPCSAYTLGSDDTLSEHNIATNQHASSFPQTRRKRSNSRAVGRSCSPDAMAALKAKVSRTNTGKSWQDFPVQQPSSLNAVAAPASTHHYSVGRAQSSLLVDSAQHLADTTHLCTPDLPCHLRPDKQQSYAQTDSMHESEQTTGQAEAQTDVSRLPQQRAGASQCSITGTNASLCVCAVLAGACKHASLSLAAQMGFASAYVLFVSQQRSEDKAKAVDRQQPVQQKAVVLQDSICATAAHSRQPAAEETLLDTGAAAVGVKQHLAASTTVVLPANSAVALSDGDAQVLNKPEVNAQQPKQNADPSDGQVCYFATSLSSASK